MTDICYFASLNAQQGVSYEDALQDGVLLCKLMNKLAPGSVNKINPGGTGHFKMVENLNK